MSHRINGVASYQEVRLLVIYTRKRVYGIRRVANDSNKDISLAMLSEYKKKTEEKENSQRDPVGAMWFSWRIF